MTMAFLFGALGALALVSRTGCTDNTNGLSSDGVQELEYTDVDLGLTQRGPHFDIAYSRNVTALVGKTAQLNCRVHDLGNRTIRFPQRRDSGIYECQVGTTPPIGHRMYLSVVEPLTTILGGPELFINMGSTINLTCVVQHSPEPPPAIRWTHNDEEINYDSPRGGVSVITEKGEMTTSHLLVQKARTPDSGRYTCAPANANPRSVLVHVLSGEHPAAMQHGGQLRLQYPLSAALLSVIVTLMGC
ncbi:protogenin B-like isoform X2 [Nymphalis io]|uniref:protogenin B-like isoform X2 n=1 Tax=Inachis io TaxID=171585 RepID=UPI002166FBF6|nr:protogenin B-like isoform X2 [Nymphalis io]